MMNPDFLPLFQLNRFNALRDNYFDVTLKDAIEVVRQDTKKAMEAREEDVEFIQRLRLNQYVAFGARDWEQQARFNRTAERLAKQDEAEEKERKRKLVSSQPFFSFV